ncbi:MAG: hypothetical protein C0614_08670 [Desulfuromonas sp.]|nr:MAG: hypothetical protein C0614_08670 [Desulfuromonas sp.]
MNLRKLSHALHRDIGYLCIGLTLIYALSGIAVNHIRDWNPSYRVVRSSAQIAPNSFRGVVPESMVLAMLRQIGEPASYDHIFQNDPQSLTVFVEGRVIEFDLATGKVEFERVTPRPFWHAINALHLNHPKKAWTWIADLYAGGLILLSATGRLLLPKGRIRPRCLLLTLSGFLVPLIALAIYG